MHVSIHMYICVLRDRQCVGCDMRLDLNMTSPDNRLYLKCACNMNHTDV